MILLLCHMIAHMWYGDEIHDANTNEDLHNPERTRRVGNCQNSDHSLSLQCKCYERALLELNSENWLMVYSLWFKDVSIPWFLFYTRDSDILLAGFLEEFGLGVQQEFLEANDLTSNWCNWYTSSLSTWNFQCATYTTNAVLLLWTPAAFLTFFIPSWFSTSNFWPIILKFQAVFVLLLLIPVLFPLIPPTHLTYTCTYLAIYCGVGRSSQGGWTLQPSYICRGTRACQDPG